MVSFEAQFTQLCYRYFVRRLRPFIASIMLVRTHLLVDDYSNSIEVIKLIKLIKPAEEYNLNNSLSFKAVTLSAHAKSTNSFDQVASIF